MHVGHGHVSSRWIPVVKEHFERLTRAGFDGDIDIGLVGDAENRLTALDALQKWGADLDWGIIAQADEGYEQVTISAMHQKAKLLPPETPILYAHTKGAYQDTPFNRAWRRSMETFLIGDGDLVTWRMCAAALENYDLVGSHWLTHDEFPVTVTNGKPMFGGNFWWATAGYLAKLPPVEGGNPNLGYNRYKAEEWIGGGNPKVLDLKPGWPDYQEEDGGYNSVLGGRLHA
jgi:hypothetical protein